MVVVVSLVGAVSSEDRETQDVGLLLAGSGFGSQVSMDPRN
jgi:hypothetical protein